tara:strand:+ start:265 stop:489 length:225 start_codon:yes stop_codon:yes gene_type:complete
MENLEYNKATLKLLVDNKKTLLEAERRILVAIVIDLQQGEETVPIVTEKLFEISDTILLLTDQIEKCRRAIKKS